MRAFVLFAMLLGCGEDSKVNVTKTVGSAGGTVDHSDGTSVTIPAGALSSNANITLTSVDVPAPAGTVRVGPAYDFGPEGTSFAQSVTVTLPFDSSKIPAGRTSADILIYTAPRGSTQYTALATTLAGNTVKTSTSHFTVYLPAVLAAGQAMDLSTPNCQPQCTTGTTSCSCTETCSGSTITMQCSMTGSSGASCFCEVNGQTQSVSPMVSSCSSASALQSAFLNCAG